MDSSTTVAVLLLLGILLLAVAGMRVERALSRRDKDEHDE